MFVLRSLELFAGAGGMALGIHAAGFHPAAAIEMDRFAAQTLRANSKVHLELSPDLVLQEDARNIDYRSFADQIDLLSGGPPCQPFSGAGRKRGDTDERNMFPVLLEAVAIIRPRAVLIENVSGLLRQSFHPYFQYILSRLRLPHVAIDPDEDWLRHFRRLRQIPDTAIPPEDRYTVSHQLLDAADFGVPQRRSRVFITAFRGDLDTRHTGLEPTHGRDQLLIDQWATGSYWQRHSVPPSEDHLVGKDRRVRDALLHGLPVSAPVQPWRTVRDAISTLPPGSPRGTDPAIPNHVQHPGARIYPPCHLGSFYDYPAKALKAGTNGNPGGENVVRVPGTDQVRYFTTREAARLSTFPDSWIFEGHWGSCIRQLGNAVPVKLAHLLATAIRDRLTLRHTPRQPISTQEHTDDGIGIAYHTNGRHYAPPPDPLGLGGDSTGSLALRS